MSETAGFLAELKRRHVYRVGAAYAVGGWLLVQVITQVLPVFHISDLVQRLLVLAVVAGFPVALVLAWIYDLTPRGIVRTAAAMPDEAAAPAAAVQAPAWRAGDTPPLRPHWRLVECLGRGGHGEVWLSQHVSTHEQRVCKFAVDDRCLSSLKREVTVSRLLQDGLGEGAAAFVRVLDWSLERAPYFIESEYVCGGNLAQWCAAGGGAANIPLAQRLDVVQQVAQALAAAHSLEVLHKDLKPANVLIEPLKNGRVRARLCDFGSSDLLDADRLAGLGITRMGFTRALDDPQTSGTPLYLPPEVLAGQAATVQGDVFPLGVMLYQLVVGDLRRPLAPGWELDVEDVRLRRIIARAAAGSLARRMKTATELVERLQDLKRDAPIAAADDAPLSLAILPFVNAGGDAADDYLGNSLGEELVTAFGAIRELRVAPQSRVAGFRDAQRDACAIGRALDVQFVVDGELRKEHDQLHFAVRLLRVDDEETLWSQRCRRAFGDLLLLQEEIAQGIVGGLALKAPPAPVVRPGTCNLPAFDHFLRGRDSWMSQNENQNRASIDHLRQAVALDPAFARSHSQLSLACWTRIYFIDPDDQGALKLGFAAAEKALTLSPGMAEAHMARGQLAWTPAARFAYSMAIKEFKRALAINGRLGYVWGQLSATYMHVGMFDEAVSAAHKGLEADPGDLACRFMIAQLPVWMGDYEQGLDQLENLPRAYNPTLWYYATLTALLAQERHHEAEARLDEFFLQHPDKGGLMTGVRARTLARSGRGDEAERAIAVADSADRRFGHFHHTAYEIAGTYALLGRKPEAFKYLHEAVHTGFPCCSGIDRDPMMESLRDDPEYRKVMEWPRQQCAHFRTL